MTGLLEALSDALETTETSASFEAALATLTRDYGYEYYAYLGLGAKVCARSNYPAAWKSDYMTRSYFSIDPVVTTAREILRPFHWSAAIYRDDQNRRIEDFFTRAAKFNIRSGLSFPISIGLGGMAMLTVASRHDAVTSGLEIDPVFAAATVGHIHAQLRNRRRANGSMLAKLKPEEAICLTWYAQGKSFRDIATIEGMKYSNVCFHMSNARKKLNASTSAQAAVHATRLKLIEGCRPVANNRPDPS